MDSLAHFLRDLATVLMAAGLVVVLFQRLRWPLVAGYLVAGLLVGPHVPPALVADQGIIRLLAELGVVLLMFSLGLDFRVARLFRIASTAGLAATVEIALMLALGYAAGQALGWTPVASLFAGGIVAISSTMIVAKVFAEQQVETRLRDAVLGILIFEDLAAILLIAVLTAAATRGQVSQQALGQLLLRLGLFLLLFLSMGQLLVPRLVRMVAGQRRAETLVVTAVGLCFGLAWLAQAAGFSVALGAFLAGVLAAESGIGRLVEDQVRPVRDVFAAIFFVAVGMQLDPAVLADSWPVVLLFGLLVIVGKTLGVSLGSFLAGRSPRDAVQAGLSLAQIGEFSFIIAGIGVTLHAAHPGLIGIAVTVSTVTAFLSPFLIRRSAAVAAWVDRRLPHQVQTVASLYGSWIEQLRAPHPGPSPWRRVRGRVRWLLLDGALVFGLVVLGDFASGPLTALAQRIGVPARAASFVVGAAVLAAVAPFLVGIIRVAHDLARELATIAVPLPPPHAVDNGHAPRRTLAVALEIGLVLVLGGPLVVLTSPFVPRLSGLFLLAVLLLLLGLAFWRSAADLQGHFRAGAEVVVAALAKQSRADISSVELARRMLPGLGDFTAVRVSDGAEARGRTLGSLNLRGRTGATVVGLLRGDHRIPFPDANERLQGGDLVALTGSHEAIEAAEKVLRGELEEGGGEAVAGR